MGEASNYPATQAVPSTLTRAAVQEELAAPRAQGTMPQDSEAMVSGLSLHAQSTRTRAEVRDEAIAASRSFHTDRGEF